jgi:hypothetical protein
MNTKFGRELHNGDFIVIASDHHLELGFFIDRFESEMVRYYTFFDLINWMGAKDTHLHINHIKCQEGACKMLRYSPGMLNGEYLELYNKSQEVLKLLKIK